MAFRLSNVNFTEIFSSDLKRAKDTTYEIYKYHEDKSTPLIFDSQLREKSAGIFTGKLQTDYKSAALVNYY